MKWDKEEVTRERLRTRLAEESQHKDYGRRERLLWVASHLEEYVDRLDGALSIPGWSMVDLADSDTLGVVVVGAEVMEREISTVEISADALDAWETFRRNLQEIQRSAERGRSRTRRLFASIMRVAHRRSEVDHFRARTLSKAVRALRIAIEAETRLG